jgi:high affinity sulfate transporter 1
LPDVPPRLARYVPILGWIPTYDRRDLRPDLVAGIVSWGVMVPVAMAYAGLAGLPPQAGLVTAFAAMAAYAVFGTTRHLKVTASSSVSVMSAAVVGALAAAGDPRYVELSAMLALLVGLFLLAAGVARLGFMSQFLAKSVVTGFVIGLAITIIIGQLPALLGIPSSAGGIIERLVDLAGYGSSVNVRTLVVGVSALVLILVLRRVTPRIPGALVALVGGIVISAVLDLASHGVAVVGEVETGVPLPSLPSVGIRDIAFLATGAVGIVFLSLAESLGAGRSFASRHGYDLDPDQELVALGASNLATGTFGGFVVDASLSQSATAEAAGARTQLASLVTSGLVLGTAIVLAPLFADLPKAVLAAIVITSVLSVVDLGELRRYWAFRRTDLVLAMTALVGVVATSALVGMVIAVMLSLAVILFQASQPYMARLGKLPGKPTSYGDLSRHPRAREVPGVLILRPDVPLTFVNSNVAKDQIVAMVRGAHPPPEAVVLDLSATADLDIATIDMFGELIAFLRDRGIALRLAQVRGTVRDRMRRSGLMDSIGEAQVYLALVAAVEERGEDAASAEAPESSPAGDGNGPDSDAETASPPN